MSANFKISRGEKANLPKSADDGTIYFCTDTGEIYIGVGTELIQINAFKAHQMFGNKVHGESFNDYINNEATGEYAHAENKQTHATGQASHAEGANTQATNTAAHAEGSQTQAKGKYSHAEGEFTTATESAEAAHVEGWQTKVTSSISHVQGKYNYLDASGNSGYLAHIVGNGTDANNRSNAHTLDWNGNAWFAGDVYVGSTSGTNKDTGSKKLSTEEYVDNKVDQVSTDKMKNAVTIENENYNAIIRLASFVPEDGKTHIIEFTEETGGGGTTTSELHWAEW